MVNNLRDLLMHVNQVIEQVTLASSHFIEGTWRTSETSEAITSSAQEVSSATALQLQALEQPPPVNGVLFSGFPFTLPNE